MNKRMRLAAAVLGALTAACSTTQPGMNGSDPMTERVSINAQTNTALTRRESQMPSSTEIPRRVRCVLVFPKVVSADFVVGGSHGKGELRVHN